MSTLLIGKCGFDADRTLLGELYSLLKGTADAVALLDNHIAKLFLRESSTVLAPDAEGYLSVADFCRKHDVHTAFSRIIVVSGYNATAYPEELEKRIQEMLLLDGYSYYDLNPLTKLRIEVLTGEAVAKVAALPPTAQTMTAEPVPPSHVRNVSFDEFAAYRRHGMFSQPSDVLFQLVDQCSKRCPKCFYYNGQWGGEFGTNVKMPLSLAEKVLRELAALPVKPNLHLGSNCEPMLYPQLDELLCLCDELKLPVTIVTNGMHLNENSARMLLSHPSLANICLSIDAATEETYRLMQPPGKLADVERNLDRFLLLKGSRAVSVSINFVYATENAHEFPMVVARWGEKVNSVSATSCITMQEGTLRFTPFSEGFDKTPCPGFWKNMTLKANGEYDICTQLEESRTLKLHSGSCSVMEYWNHPGVVALRDSFTDGTMREACRECIACGNISGGVLLSTEGSFDVITTPQTKTYRHK